MTDTPTGSLFLAFLCCACGPVLVWLGWCVVAACRRDWLHRSIKRRPWAMYETEERLRGAEVERE